MCNLPYGCLSHHTFKRKGPLPFSKGLFSACMPFHRIVSINKSVKKDQESSLHLRGPYIKLSGESKAEIALYAMEAVMCQQQNIIQRSWERKSRKVVLEYGFKNISLNMKGKEKQGSLTSVKCLPKVKRGKPLALGDELDTKVQEYIRAMRNEGAVVTIPITIYKINCYSCCRNYRSNSSFQVWWSN